MIRRSPAAILALAAWIGTSVLCGTGAAATRYDPSLRFRSITTPHFVIHYHQGEEEAALRLSTIVEAVYTDLTARLQHAPGGRTHVVLVDQADDPNGWTTPVPYNLIEITAVPPTGASSIGNTGDWLQMVFTHEYAHVLHLDQSQGWARLVRGVFGRVPIAFPNLALPLWEIEGLATFEESHDGEGRVPAGDFHAVVGQAARAGTFEPLDRVSGGLVDWPSGYGWYAYGAYFHDYLARRFGEDRLAELSHRTAGRLPYLGLGAFKRVFGASLDALWSDFAREEARQAGPPPNARVARQLTHHGYLVDGPRYDHDGTIVYTRRDAHEFPSLNRITPGDGEPAKLADRYGGELVALGPDALYFDQREVHAQVALEADIYRLDRQTGTVRRLTHGARLTDLDLSPDGTRVAAVHNGGGTRTLVVVTRAELDSGRRPSCAAAAHTAERDVVYAAPRWSPDGRRIAVERRARGGPSQIVLVDPETRATTVVVTSPKGRNVTPAWTRDGRALIFASDRAGGNFDLYRVSVTADGRGGDDEERLTSRAGGARSPDVSPDGGTVVFVGYAIDGYHLFTIPLEATAATPNEQAAPVDASRTGTATRGAAPCVAGAAPCSSTASDAPTMSAVSAASRPYRPGSTLLPRAWFPVVEINDHETRVGASAGGADALGYHAWAATTTWSVARDAAVAPVSPGARPDLLLAYSYDRWRPTFLAQAADATTPLLIHAAGGAVTPVAIRERSVDAGVALPFRRVRWSQSIVALWRREHDDIAGPSHAGAFDRGSARLGWAANTARRYGYSIAPEGGVTAGLGVEVSDKALGSDGAAQFYRGDVRAFIPVGPRHGVLAIRATGAASRGDPIVTRTLRLGGHTADDNVLSFEEDASSLLRAFPADAFLGRNVALTNVEYRLPLAYVERGIGSWPVFLRALHVTGFVDAGQAWTSRFNARDAKISWGAESGGDITAGFEVPLTVVVGVAWGRDGSGVFPDARQVYGRIGWGF